MQGEIILYQTGDGETRIEVRLENETVWLSQKQLGELFQKAKATISEHIKNIFEEGELEEKSTVRYFRTVQTEGKRDVTRDVEHYNLDAIISVGYRVNSHRGTQFRIWATQRLREYLVKGFTLDDDRLKSGGQMNYFDELLARIRDIRSSEKILYQKIRDIYTTSIDYEPNSDLTKGFFATIQNKLHWAIHGHTGPELIVERASADKPNMGLNTWKGEKIRKPDVTIAKNYLDKDELELLNLLVEQYLAFAETQAKQQKPMYMKDWIKKLHDILTINEREILLDAGRISRKLADEHAHVQFEKYTTHQRLTEKEESIKEIERAFNKVKNSDRK
jgi:hypothetical protein